ncbi:hypothetical protein ACHHYP_00106 [Achlya hypogyna]|uniref:VPS9 domain-containing protein n=1 Tax=Achlya hypogyna TaxID=1202772 RepID=A0A1V9ZBF1_ACHHY|nr:hypothetical protein ACHHYP_00106 [Achlya hypogyna]
MVGPWLCHPLHYHSFHGTEASATAKQSSSYGLSWRLLAPKSPSVHCLVCKGVLEAKVVACLACGLAVHRACLSKSQRSSSTKREDRVIPVCTAYIARTMGADSPPSETQSQSPPQLQLLEDLSLDPLQLPSPKSPKMPPGQNKALEYLRRYAPYVAGGVLVGGAAVMGMPVVALTGIGVGLSASTTKGWANRKIDVRGQHCTMDTDWARSICWDLKQKADIGDASYKQDAALLRRYHNASGAPPTSEDIYHMLFGLFSSTDELVGRVNSALCDAFRARRQTRPSLAQTIEDAQVYVGHVLAVTMNTYPALSTTDQSMIDATEAVERIIYRQKEYAPHDATLRARVREVRAMRPDMSVDLYLTTGTALEQREIQSALEALKSMQSLKVPAAKLHALSRAFRSICTVAEARFAEAPNADTLLPMVMDLIVYADMAQTSSLVAQLAFVSTLTHGGGRGVEGYALTTFHVALRALASIDVEHTWDDNEAGTAAVTDDEDEFYDAVDA